MVEPLPVLSLGLVGCAPMATEEVVIPFDRNGKHGENMGELDFSSQSLA